MSGVSKRPDRDAIPRIIWAVINAEGEVVFADVSRDVCEETREAVERVVPYAATLPPVGEYKPKKAGA